MKQGNFACTRLPLELVNASLTRTLELELASHLFTCWFSYLKDKYNVITIGIYYHSICVVFVAPCNFDNSIFFALSILVRLVQAEAAVCLVEYAFARLRLASGAAG